MLPILTRFTLRNNAPPPGRVWEGYALPGKN